MPLISLIHPSRGRPDKSYANASRWAERAGGKFELIVSIDYDDPFKDEYIASYKLGLDKCYGWEVLVNNNRSVVEATNIAMQVAYGDIICYFSDDFDCPENWVSLIEKEFADATGPRLVKVDDMLQPFHVRVLTIPIMNRALYERLGYFFHPGYKSMFCDEHLFHVANKLGALKFCPHLKFEHKHVSVGKAEDDETYRRSSANWKQGQDLFETHKRHGFPL